MSALLLVGVIVFVEPVFAQGGVFGSWSISALVRLIFHSKDCTLPH